MKTIHKRANKGFTLLEILLVIATIGILVAIVLVAINPNRQISGVRNAERRSEVNTLYKALEQYNIDNGGVYPTTLGLTNELKEICNTSSEQFNSALTDCTNKVDLRVLVPTYLTGIPSSGGGYVYKVGINDNNNRISLVLTKDGLNTDISINPIFPLQDQVFTTPGTYSFNVPEGVTKISAILVGGGGGGAGFGSWSGAGGGGGGLRYSTRIDVVSGESLIIQVGAGGTAGNSWNSGGNGGKSSINRNENILLEAFGGGGGPAGWAAHGSGGSGSPFSSTVSGGNGGDGAAAWPNEHWWRNYAGSGGGGAGGYSGNGGHGGGNMSWTNWPGRDGTGGGAGGGADGGAGLGAGGAGGGVGLYGEGVSGLGGGNIAGNAGKGGSGGEDGITGVYVVAGQPGTGRGGNFGGGGGGANANSWSGGANSRGGGGAVRIIWRRSF